MRYSLPPSRPVGGEVVLGILSSSGAERYPVRTVPPDGVLCPCRGSRYAGHCRHVRKVRQWLEAVVPPGDLPR